ncbi:ATP-binding protein [Candidatus Obscuribacterales bacterium]|nr:ATP-binding protein [Candidatus Obscuribacterales bacterium]
MMKRIIITGASGVGKTTIVEALTSLLSLPMIPELGREICHQMGYQNPTEIPDQNLFKQSILTAQIEREEELQSFISDRSTIDCWVLWQRWNMCAAMSYDTEAYYETARTQALKYTHIIYIPPMFPPVDDGFRWTDLDYQKQVDRITRMTLFELDLWNKTFTVTKLGVEERVREVQEWLSNMTASATP